MITLSTLVRDDLIPAANRLAACKGQSLADLNSYQRATYRDPSTGNEYAWGEVQVSDNWIAGMMQPLTRPSFDADEEIDMTLAAQAMASLSVLQTIPEGTAIPSAFVVYIGTGLPQAFGLERIVEE